MTTSKRIYELDVARIICVLTLPFIHIMEFWGDMYGFADILSVNATSVLNTVCEILCIFVAPTFMICMGINMSFTKHNTPKDFLKRGIILLLVELLLNILRYELPGLLSLGLAKAPENRELVLFSMRLGSINSDILTLAGLAFIVYALFKKLNLKPSTILIISFVLFGIDFVLNKTIMPSIGANMNFDLANLMGSFIYTDENSTFPIMEWLMYISSGYCLGIKIKTYSDEERVKLFKGILLESLIVFIACLLYAILFSDNAIEALCKASSSGSMTPLCLIGEISASFLFMSVIETIYHLTKLSKNDKFNAWATNFSNNITYFYCVQWTIVGWGMMFGISLALGSKFISLGATLLIYVILCFVSYYVGIYIHEIVKKRIG